MCILQLLGKSLVILFASFSAPLPRLVSAAEQFAGGNQSTGVAGEWEAGSGVGERRGLETGIRNWITDHPSHHLIGGFREWIGKGCVSPQRCSGCCSPKSEASTLQLVVHQQMISGVACE